MSHTKFHWLFVKVRRSVGSICLAFCIPLVAFAQSADETALRTVAEKFFAAYQREDLGAVMALWSEKSPDLAASEQTIEQTFAAAKKIELKSLTVRKVGVDGENASVRVVVEMSAVDEKTGKPAERFGKMNRTLHCVKEGADWKIWRYVPSEEDLAAAIVAAKTEEERKTLLAGEKDLMSVDFHDELVVQGQRLFSKGSYLQARTVYDLALNIAEQLGDKMRIANVVRNIGNIFAMQGNYIQALEHYQGSLKLLVQLENKEGIERVLNNIGVINGWQGNYSQALEYFRKSLKLADELGDKKESAVTLSNLGDVFYWLGDYTQALDYFQKSLKLKEEVKFRAGFAVTLRGIGNTYRSKGDYAQALKYYQMGLKSAQELGDKADIASTLNNIGLVHARQGNDTQALEYYKESLALNEQLGNKGPIANVLNNLGLIHYSRANYADALEYYKKALILEEQMANKTGIARVLANLALVHHSRGNYDDALEHYQKSLKLGEDFRYKALTAAVLKGIGSLQYSKGNYEKALEFANRAVAIAEQIEIAEWLWEARTTAGRAYQSLNKPDRARQAFADAITTIEKLRTQSTGSEQEQQRFFENKISPYYAMVDLLIDQSNPNEALAYAERAKGRVLLDVLSSGKVNIAKAMTQAEQEQERRRKGELVSLNTQVYREKLRQQSDENRLADLNARLQKARLEYEAFQTNLHAAHPELKGQRGETQLITVKELATLIPDAKTALLEFVVMEDKTYLFVLAREQGSGGRGQGPVASEGTPVVKVYKLDMKQKDLADRARRFRQRLANHDAVFQDLATELYDLLLKPARAQLQNKTTLVIVPDGVLWELPFQALMPAKNRYLIEDHAISYAPSLTVLREMMKLRERRAQSTPVSPTLLAFGNPIVGNTTAERVKSVFMDEKLVPLPEAEKQVKAIGRLYGAKQSKVYIGAEAREDRAKREAGNCRILHLASHGILNNASPMYSQIVLSQPDGSTSEDGLLEAWQIMNLDLKADLVVLSACDTARGRVGAGEGVIGLAWALFVAGCPTTVASQWNVESASTTQLMVEFHRRLKGSMLPKAHGLTPPAAVTKAGALRQAALTLLKGKQYRHPFYWAAFVMIGDGR